mmetsp:Transcript_16849/g.26184  ORF Transcript_16849/g.26184 Transcript_16849/m.26184 type:complete len:379 (+) Transcript_16849:1-1137(+)
MLRKISMRFPHYLIAWGDDYCFESEAVLSSLIEIARRSCDPASSPLLSSFRSNLGEFVLASESLKARRGLFSVFEAVPVRVQRLYLRLLVLLGSPSSETLRGLAATCARCGISPECIPADLRDEIVDSIHAVRKSLPMRDYFGFLVSSAGVQDHGKKSKQANAGNSTGVGLRKLSNFDSGIERVTLCLRSCGSKRSVKMLSPQLLRWLDPLPPTVASFWRYRACAAILTILLHEMKAADVNVAIAEEVGPEAVASIAAACLEVSVTPPASGGEWDNDSEILLPFVSLLRLEPSLLIPVFKNLSNSIHDKRSSAKKSLADILQIFLRFLDDSKISDPGVSETLLCALESLKTDTSTGTERQLFEKLQAFLKVEVEAKAS